MMDVTSNPAVSPDTCYEWINRTAYFFPSQRYHIYFRLLSYYNLYKTLLDTGARTGQYVVVRMTEAAGYKFGDFERALFPELMTLSELPEKRVCFREVVFSPWAYASVMFRCKEDAETRDKCLDCNGKGLSGSSLAIFRTRALQACSLVDQTPEMRGKRSRKSIVFVKRKQYHRWDGDMSQNFQRILTNQDEFVGELKSLFPDVDVHEIFMEEHDICEQMRLVHECDVFIGVHGAGLVHCWWLQDDAVLLELTPLSHTENRGFRTLTSLAGRRYRSLLIAGDKFRVSVDIEEAIKLIESISDLR
jgi:protein O-GlcNAc transferase